jgi:hypothetical protein
MYLLSTLNAQVRARRKLKKVPVSQYGGNDDAEGGTGEQADKGEFLSPLSRRTGWGELVNVLHGIRPLRKPASRGKRRPGERGHSNSASSAVSASAPGSPARSAARSALDDHFTRFFRRKKHETAAAGQRSMSRDKAAAETSFSTSIEEEKEGRDEEEGEEEEEKIKEGERSIGDEAGDATAITAVTAITAEDQE